MNINDKNGSESQNAGTSTTATMLERNARDAGKKLATVCIGLCLLPVVKTLHHDFEKLSPAVGLELALQVVPLLVFFLSLKRTWARHPWVLAFAGFLGEWVKRPFLIFLASLLLCNSLAYIVGTYQYEVDRGITWSRTVVSSWLPTRKPHDPLLDVINGH